jgi:hypothetical protein
LVIVSKTKTRNIEKGAEIEGKLSVNRSDGEELTYYIPRRTKQLEKLCLEIFQAVSVTKSILLICDSLEKLTKEQIRMLLEDTFPLLPTNILLVVTGDTARMDQPMLDCYYESFEIPLSMDNIESTTKLLTFITGRIKAYSIKSKTELVVDQQAAELLMDRTGGNLRECFRYCSFALPKTHHTITQQLMMEAILQCDKPRMDALEDIDRKILIALAATEYSLAQILLKLADSHIKEDILRKRLESLVNFGFARKQSKTAMGTHKTFYSIPKTIQPHFVKKLSDLTKSLHE